MVFLPSGNLAVIQKADGQPRIGERFALVMPSGADWGSAEIESSWNNRNKEFGGTPTIVFKDGKVFCSLLIVGHLGQIPQFVCLCL